MYKWGHTSAEKSKSIIKSKYLLLWHVYNIVHPKKVVQASISWNFFRIAFKVLMTIIKKWLEFFLEQKKTIPPALAFCQLKSV